MPPSARTGIPAYARIQETIQRRIDSGELKPGDPVDSERLLARTYGVSLMTARHALVTLEREGMVERKRGSGTAEDPFQQADELYRAAGRAQPILCVQSDLSQNCR